MFKFYQPANVIIGEGELSNIGFHLAELGLERAFIVADEFQLKVGTVSRVQESVGDRIVGVSTDVEPNPSLDNVTAASEKAATVGADSIIAIGGGSAMDCAKAVAVVLAEKCAPAKLLRGYQIKSALPVIAIPTTAGTGSEVTAGAVLSDKARGVKAAIFSPAIFPRLALVDPELTYTVPPAVTAATGLDVLAHSLDALTSVKANEATDALALKAIKLAVKYLERAVSDGGDKEARNGMSKASTIAGLAFSQTGTTGSHACSYILTSKWHVPHGEACAFTLDAWVKINAEVRPELNDFAREAGFRDADDLSAWLNKLKKAFGMRTTLAEIGAGEADLDEITDSAMTSGNMANNVARHGRDRVRQIFVEKLG
ncbi:MAG: iron-containing alcohol dehydrogenase [Lachnospiraceae bacterium]|nr:iron-containing alcohol dehydrogenase [Lachnospiraceae bacterium]